MQKLTDKELTLPDAQKAELALRRYTGRSKLQVAKDLQEFSELEVAALADAGEKGSSAQVLEVVNFQATRRCLEQLVAERIAAQVTAADEADTVLQ